MARVQDTESRITDVNDFEAQAKEYAFLKKQIDYLEKQQKELREKLFAQIEESGEVDDRGNLVRPFDKDVEGFVGIMKQRRVTRKVDEGVAEQMIYDKGLENELYKTIRVVDEDALMAALYEGKLTEEEIDEMYPQNVVWALVLKK